MPYLFDKDSFSFKKVTTSVSHLAGRIFVWLTGSMALALIAYVAFSMLINTDLEKRLMRENRMYERLYEQFLEQQNLIGDVTDGLQTRDNDIYTQIFHTEAPSVDPISTVDIVMYNDSTSEKSKVTRSAARLQQMTKGAGRVEENFLEVFALLAEYGLDNIPLSVPVDDMSYGQTGASTGMKLSPFYKIEAQHSGLDIIAGQGEPVLATADGTVADVVRTGKGLGNVVTIDHGNGYVTRYAHLSDISVSKGQKVTKGKKIATVGVSGNTFAPHLHYEVLYNDVPQDPVNYMFATLSPSDYANVAYMSSSTGQSLD